MAVSVRHGDDIAQGIVGIAGGVPLLIGLGQHPSQGIVGIAYAVFHTLTVR